MKHCVRAEALKNTLRSVSETASAIFRHRNNNRAKTTSTIVGETAGHSIFKLHSDCNIIVNMPVLTPHLPADFLQKLKEDPMMADHESMVFTSEFHTLRLGIINHMDVRGPDDRGRVKLPNGSLDHIMGARDATFAQIHLSAIAADPLHLCEMIRLGADMDLENSMGHTALFLAMQSLAGYLLFARSGLPFPGSSVSGGATPPIIKRFAFIARTLIEQHVDVNRMGDGMTILHLACQMQDWDLITLLLKHGAKVSVPGCKLASPVKLLPSAEDKSRFLALARSISRDGKRPAQPCPCWSGKLLVDCHAKNQPYPAEFYCVCGSQKSYGKCCSRRNMVVFEQWNEKDRYLKHMNVRFAGPTVSYKGEGENVATETTQDMIDALHISLPAEFLDDNSLTGEEAFRFLQRIGVETLSRGIIDLAYAYAIKEVQFLPR